jgi:hypothetical protein
MEAVARCRDVALGYAECRPVIVAGLGEYHCPRAIEGAHPDRILCVRNAETPSGSGLWWAGGLTVRDAERLGGRRMTKKRMPVAERQRETMTGLFSVLLLMVVNNRPDTGSWWPGRVSGLTWSGGPVMRKMTTPSELTDKLDAATANAGVVSGPEDTGAGWHQIDWRHVEREVRRLRQRIFTASRAGDLARVRRLQRLMLRSRSNALVSVRRVTERNAGRLTAGVDGEVVLTPEAKLALADRVQHPSEPFKAMPVRRVHIPKPGAKKRPLGIPVIADRAHQARVVNALEPEWEARFEPKSYGFRPGRGCHDAIQAIYQVIKARARNAGGCWTLTWPGRLTGSPTPTSWPRSGRSPRGA